ncbi:MAG: flagellar biosynthetic protein FliO [Planctomycetota bacterium]
MSTTTEPSPEPSPLSGLSATVQTIGALTAVVGAIVGFGVAGRQIARRQGGLAMELGPGGRAPSGVLSVLGRYPVARGQTLVLLKLDTRVLLLNQSVGGRNSGPAFQVLTEITEADEVASILGRVDDDAGNGSDARFRDALARLEQQRSGGGGPMGACEVVDLTGDRPGFSQAVRQAFGTRKAGRA